MMESFDKFLEKHYPLPKGRKLLIKTLEQHDLLIIMEATHNILFRHDNIRNKTHHVLFTLSNGYFQIVNRKMNKIKSKWVKSKVTVMIKNITLNFLIEFLVNKECCPVLFLSNIDKAIKTTCLQCNYEYDIFAKLFELE